MAIRELMNSYGEHDTADGWTVQRTFVALWADWSFGNGVLEDEDGFSINSNFFFPTIGEELPDRSHLTVTDRAVSAVNNELCNIVITYSTKGTEGRTQTENQVGSWEEELDVSLEEVSVESYTKKGAGAGVPVLQVWKKVWAAESEKHTEENAPDLTLHIPRVVLTVTAYSDVNYRKRIIDNVGKANSTHLLSVLASKKQLVDPKRIDDVDGNTDDIGKWLFMGARMRRVRNTSYQYAFTFVYDGDGWNTFQGVTHDHYASFDMVGLLDDMDNTDDDFHSVPDHHK